MLNCVWRLCSATRPVLICTKCRYLSCCDVYRPLCMAPVSPRPLLCPPSRTTSTTASLLAKAKDRKKDKRKSVHVDENLLSEVLDIKSLRSDLQAAVDSLRNAFMTKFAVRTAVGSVESLTLLFEGDQYPLNELAQVTRKSNNLLVINSAAFPQAVGDILRAIQNSGMGLNPQQDGTTIYVQLPRVTREHREQLSRGVKAAFIKTRDDIKSIQNRNIKTVKDIPSISQDVVFSVQEQLTALANDYVHAAEALQKTKTDELLGDK